MESFSASQVTSKEYVQFMRVLGGTLKALEQAVLKQKCLCYARGFNT